MATRTTSGMLGELFGCSVVDGCAPLSKAPGAGLELGPDGGPSTAYAEGDEVTCKHQDMEAWYHATVNHQNPSGSVSVTYMDGEVDPSLPQPFVFPGHLSMSEVTCALEVRSGSRHPTTGVSLPVAASTSNVPDYVLAGMGIVGDRTAGLYLCRSQAGRLKGFRGLSSQRLADDAKFTEALLSPQTTTLLLLHISGRAPALDALKSLNVTSLPPGFPPKLKKGDTVALARSKAGLEVVLGGKSKENERSWSVEGGEGLGGILGALDEGWVRRMPEVLRG